MEAVISVMIVLVCVNYVLKQTYRKFHFVVMSAAICALSVGMTWQYAIEQSKSRISDWLANSALMLDIAVILTIEVTIQMAFCIVAARIQTSGREKRGVIWMYRVLRWFPGIMIYPVLFGLLVATIFALPGVSFPLVAWGLATVVAVVIVLGSIGLKRLLPEKEIRLEMLFLSNALTAILGIVGTVNGSTAVAGRSEVEWTALGGVTALVAVGLLCGVAVYRLKIKRITSKKRII